MPTYEYTCERCELTTDIVKSFKELERIESCEKCKLAMARVFSAPQINTSNCQFQAHFNHAFGKKIESKRQLDNEVRRIRGETGKNIVEVGNDTLQSVRKPKKNYKLDPREVGEILGHHR